MDKEVNMIDFENYEYFNKHNILTLEDLVGKIVYIAYPSQGIKSLTIRKIEYTLKTYEWFIVTNCSQRLSKLGNEIFLDEDEAREWQLSQLEKYNQSQQEKILRRERELREKEIRELERLLAKYPDEESRKLPIKNCSTCKNNIEFPPPHTCDICTSLEQEEEYSMWEGEQL